MNEPLRVTGNTPRLLKEGESPPTPVEQQQTVEELEAPHVYWTPDKAQHVVAKICHAASKFYGPSVRAAEWELELIGDPAAAVMNDWIPLRTGASSDKTANLIALAVVTGIIVALRLPDILEVHGIIKPWRPKNQQQGETSQPAAERPAVPPPAASTGTFEPQLVGATAEGGDDDKRRRDIFGASTVGAGGSFVTGDNG